MFVDTQWVEAGVLMPVIPIFRPIFAASNDKRVIIKHLYDV